MPSTDSLTSSAAGISAATATFTRARYSLVSSADAVSTVFGPRPYKVPTAGEIKTVPYYDAALEA